MHFDTDNRTISIIMRCMLLYSSTNFTQGFSELVAVVHDIWSIFIDVLFVSLGCVVVHTILAMVPYLVNCISLLWFRMNFVVFCHHTMTLPIFYHPVLVWNSREGFVHGCVWATIHINFRLHLSWINFPNVDVFVLFADRKVALLLLSGKSSKTIMFWDCGEESLL